MYTLELYAFGRSTTCGEWYIDRSRIVSRLYFVNRGSARVRIDAKEWRLSEGNFYILPRSDRFMPIEAENFDHTYFDYYSSRMLRTDVVLMAPLSDLGASYFLNFVNSVLASDATEEKRETMQALLQAFLSHVESAFPKDSYVLNPVIEDALEYIHTDFATVSTGSLAERAHLCKSYFIRLFRAHIGLSPQQYIRARRVLYGEQLLSRGMSVEAAAEACGYASVSAFYKAVRAETQKAPSALKAEKKIT